MILELCALLTAGIATAQTVPADARAGAESPPVPERIVIGSKNFPESHLLGEIYAQLLEAHTEFDVEHKSGLGGTLVCHEALVAGDIQLYPEYTGTGWSAVLKEEGPIGAPLRTYLHVQARYRELFDLEWLQPIGIDNTYALALRRERARELGVETIGDLVPHAGSLRAGFSHEFMERADGYPGLSARYGLQFGSVSGMEHALAYDSIEAGTIDVMDAYSTEGNLRRYDLLVLEDDRGFFPPYNAAPVVRGALLRRHPELRAVLDLLAFRITDQRMLALNYEVEVQRRPFHDVASEFLVAEGLLDESAHSASNGEDADLDFAAFFWERRWETLRLLAQHLLLTLCAVLLSALIAIPLGIVAVRSRRTAQLGLGFASVLQTVPSLALLAVLISVPGLGLTGRSAVLALTLYALLPILRNTYTGLREVDPVLIDSARGMGLTERQILVRIQLPIATRTILAGVRTATVITIGFATLAAFIGAGGLGEPIVTGLYLRDMRLILSGALPAAALAIAADRSLAWIEKRLTPKGLRIARNAQQPAASNAA